jgi:hypothetical protein
LYGDIELAVLEPVVLELEGRSGEPIVSMGIEAVNLTRFGVDVWLLASSIVAIDRLGEAESPVGYSNVTGVARIGEPISMAGVVEERDNAFAGEENRAPATAGLRRDPRALLGERREKDLIGDTGWDGRSGRGSLEALFRREGGGALFSSLTGASTFSSIAGGASLVGWSSCRSSITVSLGSSISVVVGGGGDVCGTTCAPGAGSSTFFTRLEGTAGLRVVRPSVLTAAGCLFAAGFASAAFVALAFAVVARVDPVALVDTVFEVDDFNAAILGAVGLDAAVFVVTLFGAVAFGAAVFDAAFAGFSGSASVFFARPRRAGAFRTLAFMSASGAASSPLAWARCARVRTMMAVVWQWV